MSVQNAEMWKSKMKCTIAHEMHFKSLQLEHFIKTFYRAVTMLNKDYKVCGYALIYSTIFFWEMDGSFLSFFTYP